MLRGHHQDNPLGVTLLDAGHNILQGEVQPSRLDYPKECHLTLVLGTLHDLVERLPGNLVKAKLVHDLAICSIGGSDGFTHNVA